LDLEVAGRNVQVKDLEEVLLLTPQETDLPHLAVGSAVSAHVDGGEELLHLMPNPAEYSKAR
jgi:hypothetical protein